MKKIGEIKGVPVVEGNKNEVTKNQLHYEETDNGIQLSKRGSDNKLNSVTGSGSGGSSNGNEVWYRIKNYKEVDNYQSSEVDLIIETLQNSNPFNVVGYYYDRDYANYIKGYALPIIPKKFNNYDLYGFALFESKFDMNGQMFIIKGDFKDMIITSDPNHPMLILMDKYCELSTKEEIEKYMNEQINQ